MKIIFCFSLIIVCLYGYYDYVSRKKISSIIPGNICTTCNDVYLDVWYDIAVDVIVPSIRSLIFVELEVDDFFDGNGRCRCPNKYYRYSCVGLGIIFDDETKRKLRNIVISRFAKWILNKYGLNYTLQTISFIIKKHKAVIINSDGTILISVFLVETALQNLFETNN